MVFDPAEDTAEDASRRAASMIRRGVITLIEDAKQLSAAQITILDEEPEDAELIQHYGFTSNPPIGSEAIVIRIGGVPELQVVIGTAQRSKRPKVADGEVKIYVADGKLIHLTASEVRLGDGATKRVARETDSITVDASSDSVFIGPAASWVTLVSAFINGLVPGTITAIPTTIAGTITSGSNVVKAVD